MIRDWWQHRSERDPGSPSTLTCLEVGHLDALHCQSDAVITGSEQGTVQVFWPRSHSDLICETSVGFPVLQIRIARFVASAVGSTVGVLCSTSFHIFKLERGLDECFKLHLVKDTKLENTSFNFCVGQFGQCPARDMVCIQSLEGYLTIVDGGHILCNRQFAWTPLLPGILKYCKTADAIITHSSDYCLEAYKISDLVKTNASDASGSIQKHIEGKLQPSWSIILGEKIIDILVGKFAFSNEDHGSEIVIVGTHTLFAFTDTGIPTYQTLLDFIPMLCTSYTSNKLEFSPSPLQHLVIISKTFQIYIFKELKVAWIAQGPRSMSHLTTGSFSDVQGYLVYLESENPTISAISLIQFKYCSSSAQSQQISEIQRKLNQVQNVINQEITPTFEMKKEILSISSSFKIDESAHSLFDTIPDHKICAYFTISLQNRATFDLNELSMSILVPSGITISHSHFSIAVLKDKAEFVSSIHASLPIASETIKILVSFKLRNNTTTRVTMMEVDIPNEIFNIYEANTHLDNGQNILKQLDIVTNKASMTLQQLYSNISLSDLDVPCSSINFKMVSSGKKCGGQNVKVTASKSSGKYCLQSNLAGLLLLPFKDLAECLKRHSCDVTIQSNQKFAFQECKELIETYKQKCNKLEFLAGTLKVKSRFYMAVQEALIGKYQSQHSNVHGSVKSLEFLLLVSYDQLQDVMIDYSVEQEQISLLLANITATTRLLVELNQQHRVKFKLCQVLCADAYNANNWLAEKSEAVTFLLGKEKVNFEFAKDVDALLKA